MSRTTSVKVVEFEDRADGARLERTALIDPGDTSDADHMVRRRFAAEPQSPETRNVEIEIRRDASGKATLRGYAMRWGHRSVMMRDPKRGLFYEQFQRAAFAESLRSDAEVQMLMNHDPTKVIGTTRNKTLRVWEDEIGLRFEVDLPDSTDGRDALELVGKGYVRGVSVGMFVRDDEWIPAATVRNGSPVQLRTVKRADLREVSVTGQPAYPSTSVGAVGPEPATADYVALSRALIAIEYDEDQDDAEQQADLAHICRMIERGKFPPVAAEEHLAGVQRCHQREEFMAIAQHHPDEEMRNAAVKHLQKMTEAY